MKNNEINLSEKISDIYKKIDELASQLPKLKESIERKGKYKYALIYYLITNILNEEINSPYLLLEVYKWFIRLRRFLFKWINLIEDYMTSIWIDTMAIDDGLYEKNKDKIKKKLLTETFNDKYKSIFNKERFYNNFNRNKYALQTKDFDDYSYRLQQLIYLRNWISHIDIFYMNMCHTKDKNKYFTSINEYINNIKYFILNYCLKENPKMDWNSFDNQVELVAKKVMQDEDEIQLKEKDEEKFNINFNKCILFIDKISKLDFSILLEDNLFI